MPGAGQSQDPRVGVAHPQTLLLMRKDVAVHASVIEILERDPLLASAWKAAHAAARFLQEDRPTHLAVDSKSSATDAVTEMDRGAESLIISSLLAEHPYDSVLGEESGERIGTSDVRWVIDPLDGTVNYIYGLPVWGVSIGVQVAGVTQAGVVVAPELQVSWCASRGQGAWEVHHDECMPIRPSRASDLASSLVATGFGYDAGRRSRQGAVVASLLPTVRDIRRVGAAVVDLCWVASGRYDAYFERGLHPWDFVAGSLIAQEAGAQVLAIGGSTYENGIMVSAPGIAVALYKQLEALGAHLT